METLLTYIGYLLYGVLLGVALWGAYCVILVWRRVAQTRFRDEQEQEEFLQEWQTAVQAGDRQTAEELCLDDRRAVPQLALLALDQQQISSAQRRQLLTDRFQRDVIADLEYRLSWVQTVIKSAPMVGLLGTVVGMMGAFTKLSTGDKVDPSAMAENIAVALITTACGLAIAIPLVFCTASIQVRMRKLEDLAGAGIGRVLEICKAAFDR